MLADFACKICWESNQMLLAGRNYTEMFQAIAEDNRNILF